MQLKMVIHPFGQGRDLRNLYKFKHNLITAIREERYSRSPPSAENLLLNSSASSYRSATSIGSSTAVPMCYISYFAMAYIHLQHRCI